MAFTNRTFGIEIEFIGDRGRACAAIREAGIECNVESYNHRTPRGWKIVTDASIGYENGELVSPILRGEEGLEQVRKVCKALSAAGCSVDRRCGVHVHVGGRGLSVDQVKNIVRAYARHESKIDAFMPPSRRGSNNRFCRSIVGRIGHLDTAQNVAQIGRGMHNYADECRYVKLNLMAWNRQKTIEFRQHSGSINGNKITNWIQFCVNFVEVQKGENAARPASTAAVRGPRRNSKKWKLIDLLAGYSEYGSGIYSHGQIARYIGSTENSVGATISQLRRAGYTIQRVGRRGNYRFFIPNGTVHADRSPAGSGALRAQRVTATPARVVDLFEGLDPEVKSFFQERASDFAA